MKSALSLLLIAPAVVPIWILVDSKKRLGSYSWGWAIFAGLSLFGIAGETGRELQALSEISGKDGFAGMLWGKVAVAYLGLPFFYRSVTRSKERVEGNLTEQKSKTIKDLFTSMSDDELSRLIPDALTNERRKCYEDEIRRRKEIPNDNLKVKITAVPLTFTAMPSD